MGAIDICTLTDPLVNPLLAAVRDAEVDIGALIALVNLLLLGVWAISGKYPLELKTLIS